MTASGLVRAARAAVFAALCVLLTAVGHVMQSGTPVPRPALAAAVPLTAAGAWCLAGRERRPAAVAGTALAVQALLHVLFALLAPPDAPPAGGAPVLAAAHHATATPFPYDAGAHHDPLPGGAGMVAAHAVAALLSAVWLAGGERAVFRLLRATARRVLAPVLRALRGRAPVPAGLPRPPATWWARTPRRLLLVRAIPSRGPPTA